MGASVVDDFEALEGSSIGDYRGLSSRLDQASRTGDRYFILFPVRIIRQSRIVLSHLRDDLCSLNSITLILPKLLFLERVLLVTT